MGGLKNNFLKKCKAILENIYLMFKKKVFKGISFLLNKNNLVREKDKNRLESNKI